MLDDTAKARGCLTKWKWSALLLLLSAAALAGAVASKTQIIQTYFAAASADGFTWRACCAGENAGLSGNGEGALIASAGVLTALDESGAETDTLDTGAETLTMLTGPRLGAWSESGLYWLSEQKLMGRTFSGGVYGAALGETRAAVITAGSGYLTKTLLLDAAGEILGEIGLTDRAMAAAALTEGDELLGLCLGTDGRWELRFYDGTAERLSIELGLRTDCRLFPWGDGAAILSEEALTFYDENGDTVGSFPLGAEQPTLAAVGNAFAALAFQRGSRSVIKLISPEGTLLGSAECPGTLRDVQVYGNRLWALDLQALRVYDKTGGALKTFSEGAQSAGMAAYPGGAWLLGNGKVCRLKN